MYVYMEILSAEKNSKKKKLHNLLPGDDD